MEMRNELQNRFSTIKNTALALRVLNKKFRDISYNKANYFHLSLQEYEVATSDRLDNNK